MDPTACLERINRLLRQSAYDEAAGNELDLACQDLYLWLKGGGFPPEWTAFPSATEYYKCREVYHNRRGANLK